MKNFWRMRACSIFSVPYSYVDHCSYLADTLFVQNKVRLKFKNEYVKAESPYRIIFCKVRRKDTERFEEALERLNNKMRLSLVLHHYSLLQDQRTTQLNFRRKGMQTVPPLDRESNNSHCWIFHTQHFVRLFYVLPF